MRADLAAFGVAQLMLQSLGKHLHPRLRRIVGGIAGRRGDALLRAGIDDQPRLAMLEHFGAEDTAAMYYTP
jgi:hypothetical protein